MKMFHSSGTASGKVERMWRWKMIIPATAIVPIVPPCGDEQDQRQGELDHRPEVGGERAGRRGQQVLGVVAVEPPLRRPRAVPGRVADHHRDDEREVVVELRRRRPPPDADEDQLGRRRSCSSAGRGRRSSGCRRPRPGPPGTGPCRAGRAAPGRRAATPTATGSRRPRVPAPASVDRRSASSR